ncbi:MAG TPA: alpha/beta fold hydrolase [Candidatus Acidoferrales bacterium]|nr:alpha/beta fold hydrolase [Candidatus Acidoferrales bacterium]
MRLNFQVQGEGFPLIILHGFLGSLDNWRSVSKKLSASSKVYSLDLRNHGDSPHSEIMNYSIMVHDLRDFCAEQKIHDAHLLGHSMGGKVAMQFTLENPALVNKLMVVDIAPKAYPTSQRVLLETLRGLDLSRFQSFREIDMALAPAIKKPRLRGFLLKNLARDSVRGFRWKINLDALIKNYDELTKNIPVREPSNKPSLFIRGGQSKYIQDEDFPLIKRWFPEAQIATIQNAGHWVQADAPVEFLQLVEGFLAQT